MIYVFIYTAFQFVTPVDGDFLKGLCIKMCHNEHVITFLSTVRELIMTRHQKETFPASLWVACASLWMTCLSCFKAAGLWFVSRRKHT